MASDPVDAYNVVWDAPSGDPQGSMPLGNGDIGLNVWTDEGGLVFYVSKTDAWNEHALLHKLGRVRLALDPNPFGPGRPFRQELRLHEGEIAVEADGWRFRVWADANRPVIHVEAEGDAPAVAGASLETWRTERRELTGDETFGVDRFAKDEPPSSYPDVVLAGQTDAIVWYHRNERSLWPVTLRHQGLGRLTDEMTDPLLHRTYGGLMRGEGFVKSGPRTLRSERPTSSFRLDIHVLTAQTATAFAWTVALLKQARETDATQIEQAREEHRRWWRDFWDRSWVRVTGSGTRAAARPIERNTLPLRIGADSDGANRFIGDIGRVGVYSRALTPEEIRRLAADTAPRPSGCVAEWTWDGSLRSGVGGLTATPSGKAEMVAQGGRPAVRLDGGGFLEIPSAPALDLSEALTLEAWIRPGRLPDGGGRILDKITAGGSNGFLFDTYPGASLRLIVTDGEVRAAANLPPGEWTHVAAVFDARIGEKRLYVNGKEAGGGDTRPEHFAVTQAYVLQRFINACGGRGGSPIKFNGSVFTVEVPGRFDPDYRRWGGCYWFQNTRLPYWPMPASGDFDLMEPLFRMFRDALPLAQARNDIYFGHGGAFFPETMHFWGCYFNGDMGYGWDHAPQPLWPPDNRYIGRYLSGGLELSAMMLDTYAFTRDERFLRETLLPIATEVVRFYDLHYPRVDGKVRFAPTQSLETWWDCVNPLPEVAGLRFVLAGLLTLPEEAGGPRADWRRFLSELPDVPTREVPGGPALAAAESFADRHNVENPELYAVFPYRLYGVGKPDLEVGRRAFEQRQVKVNIGWAQDETQAAFLGLAEAAREFLVGRVRNKHEGSRFPAFWGPNYDWIPDQDHGGNILMSLQTMLMQWDGERILLFPAWPRDWDVEFKLHAPGATVVEGVYRDGRLQRLTVTPPERKADVTILEPQGEG